MRTQLQLALDILPLDRVKELCDLLVDVVDIVEVGTPLIVRHGLPVVAQVRKWTGEKRPVFADTKIVDAGRWETMEAIEAGADLVSVLAGASVHTLEEVKASGAEAGVKMVVDTIDLSAQDESKKTFLRELSPDYLCLHLSTDAVSKGGDLVSHGKDLALTGFPPDRLMVAGGITVDTIQSVVQAINPAVAVVGSGLSQQSDPLAAAREMRRLIDELTL